jgi:hypothetical protein
MGGGPRYSIKGDSSALASVSETLLCPTELPEPPCLFTPVMQKKYLKYMKSDQYVHRVSPLLTLT